MVNQNFRTDYWVRGVRRATALEQAEALKRQRIILSVPREDVSLKISSRQRTVSMKEEIYKPVLDALADYQALSLDELHDKARAATASWFSPRSWMPSWCWPGAATSARRRTANRWQAPGKRPAAQPAPGRQGPQRPRNQLPGQPGDRRRRAGNPGSATVYRLKKARGDHAQTTVQGRLGTPVQAETPGNERRQGPGNGSRQPGRTQRPRAKIPATRTPRIQGPQSQLSHMDGVGPT